MANTEAAAVSRVGTSIFALKNRPRATRAIVKKVRTGCITCKRRHVKCDESKPSCQRCLKWGGQCEGYQKRGESSQSNENQEAEAEGDDQKPTTERTTRKSTVPLRLKSQLPQWYPAMLMESSKLLYRMPEPSNTAQGLDDAGEGSPGTPSASTRRSQPPQDVFWSTTVPLMLRTNASVWAANLAIHALIDSVMTQCMGDLGPTSYSRALKYHGMALRELGKEVASGGNLESATVCCLFFVVFEMIHGDEIAAQTHIYNGCKMIDELRSSREKQQQEQQQSSSCSTQEPGVEQAMLWELQKAMRFLALQGQGANYQAANGGSEAEVMDNMGPPTV